jgi:hypothetical protein
MANWNDFRKLWAAYFKNLTESDGIEFWAEFVSKSDWAVLRESVEKLADQYASSSQEGYTKLPRLNNLKSLYWILFKTGNKYEHGSPPCSRCDSSGVVKIVKNMKKNVIMNPSKPEPVHCRELGVYVAPCGCGWGRAADIHLSKKENQRYFTSGERGVFSINSFGDGDSSDCHAGEYIRKCHNLHLDRRKDEVEAERLQEGVVG